MWTLLLGRPGYEGSCAENAGARALGEYLGTESPVRSQSGIITNTLFDENASNHLAIGAAMRLV